MCAQSQSLNVVFFQGFDQLYCNGFVSHEFSINAGKLPLSADEYSFCTNELSNEEKKMVIMPERNFEALDGIRTRDLCVAVVILYQLSYRRRMLRAVTCEFKHS